MHAVTAARPGRTLRVVLLAALALTAVGCGAAAREVVVFEAGKTISLPAPRRTGGTPLMTALAQRRSTREFKADGLPVRALSELLWAGCGFNRNGKRTAATAHNWQNLDVYVVLEAGVFRYEAAGHGLVPVVGGDLRAATGRQEFVGRAALNLVYVSDEAKLDATVGPEERLVWGGVHAGIVAENVYLYAASAGLGAVVRASFDGAALGKTLGLAPTQRVVLLQTVGVP